MATRFKLLAELAENAQLIIFCTVAWKKVGTNVSFRSVYNGGQFQLCMMHAYMYLLYAMANMTHASLRSLVA